MTTGDDLRAALDTTPIVGIVRGCPFDHIVAVGSAVVEAGFTVIEVTYDSPRATDAIAALCANLPGVMVGAGTVRTPREVDTVVGAGASFIVSPILSVAVIETAAGHGVPSIPGASTPTEVWQALEAGASAVKVFPARELGGPSYLRAIRGPLGDPPLVPTGGVGAAEARDYLDAGALALGVGASVFTPEALAAGDAARVGSLAAEVVRSLT
jgi:2-dehydro-3-deoxyphosphogluconate aldolase/(4S)-4-hydroxy-2-oxoglutarate aldolase